jgi:hypothetical protein
MYDVNKSGYLFMKMQTMLAQGMWNGMAVDPTTSKFGTI